MTTDEHRETVQCHEMMRRPTTGQGMAFRALAIANIKAVADNPPAADQPCVLMLPAPAGKGSDHD